MWHNSRKANSNYMKDYDKNKFLSFFKYSHISNLYGWTMSQKVLVNGFKWIEDIFEFDESFTKSYNEE